MNSLPLNSGEKLKSVHTWCALSDNNGERFCLHQTIQLFRLIFEKFVKIATKSRMLLAKVTDAHTPSYRFAFELTDRDFLFAPFGKALVPKVRSKNSAYRGGTIDPPKNFRCR